MGNKERVNILREIYEEALLIISELKEMVQEGELYCDDETLEYIVVKIEAHDKKASAILTPEVMEPDNKEE